MDPLDWRSVSHVLGYKDHSLQTTRESSCTQYENQYLPGSIRLHILVDTYQPSNYSLLCSHLRRNRSWERKQKLFFSNRGCAWGVLWFNSMVDYPDKRHQP